MNYRNKFLLDETTTAIIYSFIVLISRLYFLNNGYGLDPDAWRIVLSAKHIAHTGQYIVSRFPGYPFVELTYSLISNKGYFLFNFFTAFLSAVSFFFFAQIWKKLYQQSFIIPSLCFIFTPIIYVNSTNSMDYVWGLTFMLGSLYFILKERILLSGILLGCSIGCRLTYFIMFLIFPIIVYKNNRSFCEVSKLLITTIAVTILIYLPVINSYGIDFFKCYTTATPSLSKVIAKATIHVWGKVGFLSFIIIFFANLFILFKEKRFKLSLKQTIKSYDIFWILIILAYFVLFVKLPHESAYLISTIPFIIFILGNLFKKQLLYIFCVLVLFSSFIDFGARGIEPGMIIKDYESRKKQNEFINKSIQIIHKLEGKSIIVSGAYLPIIKVGIEEKIKESIKFIYSLPNENEYNKFINDGYKIFYLKGIEISNKIITGFDLQKAGSMEIKL